jgi:hypothetical protein
MKIPALFLLGFTLAGAACGSSATVPTTVSTLVSASTEVFVSPLSVSGSAFYSFTSLGTGVQVTLGSLTNAASGAPLSTPMRIGIGIPSGTGCGLLTFKDVSPALVAQINVPLDAGTFCVSITDTGGLSAAANFAIRITQGTLTLKAGASPEHFASNLAPNGSSLRTFVMSSTGTVTLTLDSVTPSRVVGFGLGIWRAERSTCSLNQSVTSGPGANITATVDQGIYCVKVFDVGNLTDFAAFSSTIIHP